MIPPTGDATAGNSLTDVAEAFLGDSNDGIDWWPSNFDEDSPMPFDASAGGLWAGNFVPPPPRPAFLDDDITPDGVTTCDLCSWAWKDSSSLFSSLDAPGELGWLLTLIIVSLISAVIGAVIMVTILHWRRFKTSGSRGLCSLCASPSNNLESNNVTIENCQNFRMRERVPTPNSDSDKDTNGPNNNANPNNSTVPNAGVWSWLTSKKTSTSSIQFSPANSVPAENHYTHMDDAYAAVGEALYAELDRESNCSPAYQNTAYTGSDTEPDAPISSAPSSAYYSDLSVTTIPERAYEIVGSVIHNVSVAKPLWEPNNEANRLNDLRKINALPIVRLSAINETVTVQPSDYV
ncbi:uncharacterized protein LOC123294869 isoform X2 [Chrysoperla carnea]|uniref:uncharacterized protein LOC123294869 isoform X2 n=1 Tax=Chrysoperla carnea TaxID=189513 RepID=UPI001D06F97F|nr:uncharacterized protein LOC123294869 isoform X2 [Chrysoperla carnea]